MAENPGSGTAAPLATPDPTVPSVAGQTHAETRRIRVWRKALVRLGADPALPAQSNTGRWPSTWQGFLWDLAPDELAPGRDGVQPPTITSPEWTKSLDAVNSEEIHELLDLERRRHEAARTTASVAEGKASRLLTPAVALLTGATAFAAFQLNSAANAKTLSGMVILFLLAVPGIVGVVYVFVSILRALDADTRVGIYSSVGGAQRVGKSAAVIVIAESRAASRAEWTAQNKLTRLMYARAALSKAIALIVLALALATVTTMVRGFSGLSHTETPGRPRPTPTGTSPSNVVSSTVPTSGTPNSGAVATPSPS
jgi:hypothetical protein